MSEREEGRGDAAGFRRSKDEIKRLTCIVDLENRFFLECNQLRRKEKKKMLHLKKKKKKKQSRCMMFSSRAGQKLREAQR